MAHFIVHQWNIVFLFRTMLVYPRVVAGSVARHGCIFTNWGRLRKGSGMYSSWVFDIFSWCELFNANPG